MRQAERSHSNERNSGTRDLDVAQNVISTIGGDNIIYSQSNFWIWEDRGVWRRVDDRRIKQLVQKQLKKASASFVNSVTDLIKNEIYQADHIFDTDTETINCLNGEIRFIDGQFLLQSHRRETYRTAPIPVKFEPSATAPRFRQFLSEIFVNDPDPLARQQLIAECMGYTLLSTCELEKFFILVGNGAKPVAHLVA